MRFDFQANTMKLRMPEIFNETRENNLMATPNAISILIGGRQKE